MDRFVAMTAFVTVAEQRGFAAAARKLRLSPPAWTTNGTTIDQNTSTLFQAHANAPVNSGTNWFIRLHISRP